MIELATGDGQTISAYRADPEGTPRGAVVVIQEIFGVNSHIKKVADAFAAKGYVAIAPSLFDGVKPGLSLGYDEAGVAEGLEMVRQLGRERALSEIQAAVDSVKDAGKVAVLGYSWGGYLAYAAANNVKGLACAIGYYGGGIVDDYGEKRKVPTLLHFAENDNNIPFETVTQFRTLRPDVSAFSYPDAQHGFNCDERVGYDEPSAEKALERTLAWIFQYVEGQPPIQLKNSGAYAQAKVDKKKKKPAGGDDMGPPME